MNLPENLRGIFIFVGFMQVRFTASFQDQESINTYFGEGKVILQATRKQLEKRMWPACQEFGSPISYYAFLCI
jgi:hypothetical protein